jgi:hypothetical protein
LTGINKEGVFGKGMRITPIYPHFNMGRVVEDYREGGDGEGSKTTWQLTGKEYDVPSWADQFVFPKKRSTVFRRRSV